MEHSNKVYNRKRSSYISFLKRKNYGLIDQIKAHMKEYRLESIQEEHLGKLMKAAQYCSNYSLYSHDVTANDHTYYASGTCSHKCCFVCNWHRQKATRRKYLAWFKTNPYIVAVPGKNGIKYMTIDQAKKQAGTGTPQEYDLMHLTLTVPHYINTGFCGERFYFSQIIEKFNYMRKEKYWGAMVFGGEFGVETSRDKNGLNIHIHALLFVKREMRNRNNLHKWIFRKWNRLTVNPDNPRTTFSERDIQGMLKGNKDLTAEYLQELNPQGATIFSLETIFTIVNGVKTRSNQFGDDAMMKAIMETISYHFEPHAFDKEDKTINIELLSDLLPHVYKKILYKKFGCLHGEKSLNLSNQLELEEDFEEVNALKFDEMTGEIFEEREFFLLNPCHVYHDMNRENKIVISRRGRELKRPLEVNNSREAISELSRLIQNSHTKRKQ